jgi:hypothetical protein
MCHRVREKRFPDRKRLGKKGKSNSRWIVGGKLCLVLNKFGLVCGFQTDTANVSDIEFHALLREFEKEMIICAIQVSMLKQAILRTGKSANAARGMGEWSLKTCFP